MSVEDVAAFIYAYAKGKTVTDGIYCTDILIDKTIEGKIINGILQILARKSVDTDGNLIGGMGISASVLPGIINLRFSLALGKNKKIGCRRFKSGDGRIITDFRQSGRFFDPALFFDSIRCIPRPTPCPRQGLFDIKDISVTVFFGTIVADC